MRITCTGYDWKSHGVQETYFFPDGWEIQRYALEVRLKMSEADISRVKKQEFTYKQNRSSLYHMASNKKTVAILFDDTARPTPVSKIIPHVFESLFQAGIKKDNIRFYCAIGSHRPLTKDELSMKLGTEIVDQFQVVCHDCFDDNIVMIGRDSYGTGIWINKDVISSDLIIGVSSIEKHKYAYAGGGSKIILPGVAGIETIRGNHSMTDAVGAAGEEKYGLWRTSMDECAEIVNGIKDFVVINSTVSARREITSLYIGDAVTMFRDNVEKALETYELTFPKSHYADIGIFRMDTYDPLQASKAMTGMFDVCRIGFITGYFSDGHVYQGMRYGPYANYEKKLDHYKGRENPKLSRFLQQDEPVFLCSPAINVRSGRCSMIPIMSQMIGTA